MSEAGSRDADEDPERAVRSGADLSVLLGQEERLRIQQAAVDRLEAECDGFNEALPPLTSFVLPGGTFAAATLHVARAVCRRAERRTIAAAADHPVNPLAVVYLNRLSDLLFILARTANAMERVGEPLWRPAAPDFTYETSSATAGQLCSSQWVSFSADVGSAM